MEKQKNKIGGYIGIAFLVVAFVLMVYNALDFGRHHKFTQGIVTNITGTYKDGGNYSIIFQYSVNGKKYFGNNNDNFCGDLTMGKIRTLLIGKTFAVAYSENHVSVGAMIIKKDFAIKMGCNLPDSCLVYDSILTCK